MNERFEKLLAEAFFDEAADQADTKVYELNDAIVQKFADLVRADEREQCAKVCGRLAAKHFEGSYADECAMAIRARGKE